MKKTSQPAVSSDKTDKNGHDRDTLPFPEDAVTETSEGVIITIEVSAGSKRGRFPDGYNPWRNAFGIAVKAPPVEGKANKAIIELISDQLSISRSTVSILSGHTSSVKKVLILGIDRSRFMALLSVQ